MKRQAATQGWWRAADGYWYPPEARPGQLWKGEVMGPHGEEPPGPGWWLASDYQWYPPDAKPGELWRDPVASFSGPGQPVARRSSAPVSAGGGMRNDAALLGAGGLLMIIVGIALLSIIRIYYPDASTAVRLLSYLPVAVGSSAIMLGVMRYLGVAR